MSFSQKKVIADISGRQDEKEEDVHELKRLTERFSENERTQQANQIAFGDQISGIRKQFSHFFSTKPMDGQV